MKRYPAVGKMEATRLTFRRWFLTSTKGLSSSELREWREEGSCEFIHCDNAFAAHDSEQICSYPSRSANSASQDCRMNWHPSVGCNHQWLVSPLGLMQ